MFRTPPSQCTRCTGGYVAKKSASCKFRQAHTDWRWKARNQVSSACSLRFSSMKASEMVAKIAAWKVRTVWRWCGCVSVTAVCMYALWNCANSQPQLKYQSTPLYDLKFEKIELETPVSELRAAIFVVPLFVSLLLVNNCNKKNNSLSDTCYRKKRKHATRFMIPHVWRRWWLESEARNVFWPRFRTKFLRKSMTVITNNVVNLFKMSFCKWH